MVDGIASETLDDMEDVRVNRTSKQEGVVLSMKLTVASVRLVYGGATWDSTGSHWSRVGRISK